MAPIIGVAARDVRRALESKGIRMHVRRNETARSVAGGLILVGILPALLALAPTPTSHGESLALSRDAQVSLSFKVPVRVSATVGGTKMVRRVARPVRLQQLDGTHWKTITRAKAATSGRVSLTFSKGEKAAQVRVFAPALRVGVKRVVDGRRVVKRVRLKRWTSRVQSIPGVSATPTQSPTSSNPTTTVTSTPTQSPTSTPTQTPTEPPGRKPWVTGYYAGWFWDVGDMLAPEDVDMTAMTHLVFGRVAPGGGSLEGEPNNPNFPDYPYEPGDLVPGAGSGQRPNQAPDSSERSIEDYLIDRAHDAGTKALLMLGGDGNDGRGFMLSTADPVRETFVENIVDYLVEHDYDGVDVDWENCLEGDAGCGEEPNEDPVPAAEARRRLMALIAEIRVEAATRPHFAGEPVLITFPGYPLNTNYGLENGGKAPKWQADVAKAVDQYNLMSYGIGTTYNGAEWDSWFSGALDGATSSHPVDIASSVDAYVAAGVPRGRIGLGIGFYGIYWGPEITGPRQNTNNNEIWETNDVDLSYGALDRMGYTRNGTLRWDEEATSTYRTYEQYPAGYVPPFNAQYPLDDDRYPAGFLSYEDPRSIQAKGEWVKETGAGGTIIWTLNYGWVPRTQSNPLLDAVKDAFIE